MSWILLKQCMCEDLWPFNVAFVRNLHYHPFYVKIWGQAGPEEEVEKGGLRREPAVHGEEIEHQPEY